MQAKASRGELDLHAQLFLPAALAGAGQRVEGLGGKGHRTSRQHYRREQNALHRTLPSPRFDGAISSTVDQDNSPDICGFTRRPNVPPRRGGKRMVAPTPTVAMTQVKMIAAAKSAIPPPETQPTSAKGPQIISSPASPTTIARYVGSADTV